MFGMAGRRGGTPAPPEDFEENIVDIDVGEEMRGSYLEYAYSVIYSRALPDARDGLKPVQRRILYQMNEMGLRPDRSHVKCARVVGEVMGRLHPHGDSAIYDALVRLAQPFSMRLPLVDGHGNFGSLGGDDAPAAMRYTEARLAAAAMEMTASLDEDTVDFVPNYDGTEQQPEVLPAGLPNGIGPDKVVTRIKDLVQAKKLNGISDLKDLTDRHRGLRLVIEIRNGFHAEAVLDELYRLTPMEDTFGINNVALVDGQPRVL